MPWHNGDFPPSYKNQPVRLREKAVEIANALLLEGIEEGIAVATGLKRARAFFGEQKRIGRRLNKITRDGAGISPWQSVAPSQLPDRSNVPDLIYDVLIVGAGITGMTAALLLQNAGRKCLLVEARNMGFGTTGGTSAHINTFADTSFKEAEKAFGKDGSKLFAAAIADGFDLIRGNIKTYKIACDLEEKDGFLYAEDKKQIDQLDDIHQGCLQVGVDSRYAGAVPTPVTHKKALVFGGQAQFHPLKYLTGLRDAYLHAGGLLLERTAVTAVESEKGLHRVQAGGKLLRTRQVIYATHIPPGLNIFSLRCAPYRSYVLGVTLKDKAYPDALVYDMQEPYHYFRTHKIQGKNYLIAGGHDHKTGHDKPDKAFEELEKYVRKHYQVGAVKFRWSSQYYVPVDGLPYIGGMPGMDKGIYCATGYNGNGMMLGSVAAIILRDLIVGKKNKYQALFDPGRIKPIAGFREFVKENADVAYQFASSHLPAHHVKNLRGLRKEHGKILSFDGLKIAVYRDRMGTVHALNPVCTHAKCIVNWNDAEKSWDCPCHGARYDVDGIVLNGPADRNLEKTDIEKQKK